MDGLTARDGRLDERHLDVAQLLDLALQRPNERGTLGKRHGVVGHVLDLGHDGVLARATYQCSLSPDADMPPHWLWAAMCQ